MTPLALGIERPGLKPGDPELRPLLDVLRAGAAMDGGEMPWMVNAERMEIRRVERIVRDARTVGLPAAARMHYARERRNRQQNERRARERMSEPLAQVPD